MAADKIIYIYKDIATTTQGSKRNNQQAQSINFRLQSQISIENTAYQ